MPLDKQLHFLYGVAIVLVVNALIGMAWAIGLCFAAAGSKELWDRWSGKGTCDRLDAVATIFGGLCCALLITWSK